MSVKALWSASVVARRWLGFDWREDVRACTRSLRVRGAARVLPTRSAVVTKVLRNFMVAVVAGETMCREYAGIVESCCRGNVVKFDGDVQQREGPGMYFI